jgi:hypothetical protein
LPQDRFVCSNGSRYGSSRVFALATPLRRFKWHVRKEREGAMGLKNVIGVERTTGNRVLPLPNNKGRRSSLKGFRLMPQFGAPSENALARRSSIVSKSRLKRSSCLKLLSDRHTTRRSIYEVYTTTSSSYMYVTTSSIPTETISCACAYERSTLQHMFLFTSNDCVLDCTPKTLKTLRAIGEEC